MSIDVKVHRGDDFAGWMAGNNPNRLPVVQLQSTPDHDNPYRLGGWVLREPSHRLPPGDWVQVPLQARNQAEAIAEARRHLSKHADQTGDN